MAFGKAPLTEEQKANFRAQAEAELARRATSSTKRVPALQRYIDEELADLRRRFGNDPRLQQIAITFAVQNVLESPGRSTVDGEALIEAMAVSDKVDTGRPFRTAPYARWARAVTAAPPKYKTRGRVPSFGYAAASALEMYLAFLLTTERRPLGSADPLQEHLRKKCKAILRNAARKGVRFEREPEEIIDSWLSRRRLRRVYAPSGNPRAPIAFLAREFRFSLDKERRSVGGHAVRPAWVRQMKRRGWLSDTDVLTADVVESLMSRAEANRNHAPPAGSMTSATLREHLEQRQEDGKNARTMVEAQIAGNALPADFRDRLAKAEILQEIADWLALPSTTRGPLPAGAIAASVGTSPRSVDSLVDAYEIERGASLKRQGRSRLIPSAELDRIVAFANARAEKRRR